MVQLGGCLKGFGMAGQQGPQLACREDRPLSAPIQQHPGVECWGKVSSSLRLPAEHRDDNILHWPLLSA